MEGLGLNLSTPTVSPGNAIPNPELVQIHGVSPAIDLVPSRFNARSLADDGTLILYNSLRGSMTGFPPLLHPEIEQRLRKGGFKGRLEGLTKYMYERGFLVPRGTNEFYRARLLYGSQQYKPDRLELILLASEECNFRCVYCYEKFPRATMEPWVRAAVAKLVERRAAFLNSLSISWFGGEPLLGYEAIESLAPLFVRLADKKGFHYSSSMTTNGYLLTPDRFRQLLDWNVRSYQITVDGARENHNHHRPLADGGSTFDVIFDNLQAMAKFRDSFSVALRVNFDRDNLPHMNDFIDYVRDRLGRDQRFKLKFYPIGKWGGENDERLPVCGFSGEDERRQLELAAISKSVPAESKFIFMQPNLDQNVCYAARPYNLLIGADGKIMKCTIALDTKDYNIVGQLRADGVADIDIDKMAKWVAASFEDDPECRRCFYVPVCQGCSCPLDRIAYDHRPCPPEKTSIRRTLQGIWESQKHMGHKVNLDSGQVLPR